jgi:hypothetical protein
MKNHDRYSSSLWARLPFWLSLPALILAVISWVLVVLRANPPPNDPHYMLSLAIGTLPFWGLSLFIFTPLALVTGIGVAIRADRSRGLYHGGPCLAAGLAFAGLSLILCCWTCLVLAG